MKLNFWQWVGVILIAVAATMLIYNRAIRHDPPPATPQQPVQPAPEQPAPPQPEPEPAPAPPPPPPAGN